MTTRLTKEMRNQIVESVLASTNLTEERKTIEAETAAASEALMRSAQPKGFYDSIKGLPKEWFKLDSGLYVRHFNPLTALEQGTGNMYAGWNVDYPETIAYATDFTPDEAQCKAAFGKLHKRAETWVEKRTKARGELMAFLMSKSTVEAVIKDMPELERHIPAAATKSYPLVAPSNVLSHLSKLGFDTGIPATA